MFRSFGLNVAEGERATALVGEMPGPLYRLLADDHARLDGLLKQAVDDRENVDLGVYGKFRAGLLKHIGLEEKILLPTARHLQEGRPLPIAARLRLDHGAIAALLVPTPTPAIVATLQAILTVHNEIEEGPGGLYETCERLAATERDTLVGKLRAAPEVPVSPHADGPKIMAATRRALARAGYDLADYENSSA